MGKNIFAIGTYTLNKNYKIFYNSLREKSNNKLYFYLADAYTTSVRKIGGSRCGLRTNK